MSRLSASAKRNAFTRVELLVVFLFVILGGGVVMASVARARGVADRDASKNNLHVLALAIQDFGDAQAGSLPTGRATFFPRYVQLGTANTVRYGPCLFCILPHIEEGRLYKASMLTIGKTQLYASWELAGKPIKLFIAPGDPTAEPESDRTSYLVNGLAFPYPTHPRMPASFPDGTSNTIFFAEGYSQAVDLFPGGGDPTKPRIVARRWWDDPTWTPMQSAVAFQVAPPTQGASVLLPQGFLPEGIQVAMGDTSVRMVSPKCSSITFYHACTPNGNEVLGDDW
jgi:hypothetical protein